MARQILPLAGQIIGGMIGGPVGAAIGGAIGGALGNAIDPQVIRGPKLGEAGLQTSAEGVYRPIVLGTGAVKGNIIERGNRQVHTKRTRQSKGGGPVTEQERVYWTYAIRVCEAPRDGIAGILRIWEDEKLVYDVRPDSTIPDETAEFAERIRIYRGDEDQLPDPDLEAYKGIGNVNAYLGSAYVVFPDYDLTDRGERIPDYRFEVVGITSSEFVPATFVWLSGDGLARFSDDGLTFTDWESISGTGASEVISTPNRAITFSTSSPFMYKNYGGASWVEAGGVGHSGSAGSNSGQCGRDGATILVGGGIQNLRRSFDEGLSFSTGASSSPQVCNTLVQVQGGWVGQGVSRMFFASEDGGSISVVRDPVPGEDYVSIWSDFNVAMVGGSKDGSPALWRTTNGSILIPEAIPAFASSSVVTAITFNHRTGMWVCCTDGGEVAAKSDGGSWVLSDYVAPHPIASVAANGSAYLLASQGSGSGSSEIVVARSVDGLEWTESATATSFGATKVSAFSTGETPASGILLSTIVSFLHSRVEHTVTDYDVSELTDEVDGIVFAGDYTCGDAIRTLMPIYMFDSSEHDEGSGYRINYVKRGAPVVETLTADDLVDEPEETTREDSLERPRVLHMHFENPVIGYAPAKASPTRISPDVLVTGEVSVQVPVVFADVDEAWQRADVMLKVAWTEVAGEQTLTLPDSWLELCPTDTIGLVLRDQVRRLRMTQVMYQEGTLQCKLLADRQSAYTSTLTGIELPEPTPPLPSIVGPTVSEVLDIPALTDNGDRLLYYHAGQGQTPAWYGYQLQRKQPSATEFEDVVQVSRANAAIMGELLDPIPAASEHYTDTTNSVRVELYTDDVLDSLTDQQFLSEGGAFALENDDGTWEVMQYRDSQDDGNREWTLTTLLRGRLDTGGSAHSVGARFIILDTVTTVDAVTAWIGQELTHRAVSLGQSPELAAQEVMTYTAQSQTEWPVAHLFGEISGDSLALSCVPRHRFGTEDHPVQSINHDGYRWTATDGSNTASADTDASVHTFDVTGWATPITVTVSQLNRYTGAGPTVTEDIA